MLIPSAAENSAEASTGVTRSPSPSSTPMHSEGAANATTCENFRAPRVERVPRAMRWSISTAQTLSNTTPAR